MKWAALITWVLTAGGGFVLLAIWLARGGMRQQAEGGNRIRPPLIMTHFLLAAAGLVVWIIYVVDDKDALAWIAFAVLLVVALLGFTMFAIWLRRRQGRGAVAEAVTPNTPAEQHFPVAIVGLHGLLAATTLVLVLLTAIGVGGS
jgi:manganese efflux pump family protein